MSLCSLTIIIPQVRMGYESIAHEAEGRTKHLSQVEAGHQSFLAAKTLRISLLVGCNI